MIASLCLDRACRILVTGDLGVADGDLWADDLDEGESAIPVVGGVSVTAGGARLTRPGWSLDAGLGIAAVDRDVYLLPLVGASLQL